MKHSVPLNLLLALLVIYPLYGYEVSTDVQKKRILIEEFTGVLCGNCPDGHAISNALNNAQPENSYIVAIHSGSYAKTVPDYRTDAGEELDRVMEAYKAGYPCGMVNRTIFPDVSSSVLISRSQWIKKSKTIHDENAVVNLWISSNYDGITKQLKVKVEGYYPDEVLETKHYLNVLWTQSNIEGPQNGANIGSGEYIHKHMLRDYVTPVWGEEIESGKGKYFSKEYIYTVPNEIKSIDVKPEDIEVIAFVTLDKKTVLNVIGGKPNFTNYTQPLKAKLYAPDIEINGRYGYNFFELKLANRSDQPLTSATFKIDINGGEQNISWNGNIPPFATQSIQLKVSPYNMKGSNYYKIQLISLNGSIVETNTLEGNFSKPSESSPTIFIELKTDKYAEENIYTIKDQDGNIVKQFGPYKNGESAIYKEKAELEANQNYCFEVTDAWGDGVQNPPGYIKLYKDNQDLIAQIYVITLMGTRAFFTTNLPANIMENKLYSPDNIATFIEGDKLRLSFMALSSGNAKISIYSLTGKQILCEYIPVLSDRTYAHTFSLENTPKGIYLLNISLNTDKKTFKFIYQ